MKKVIFMFVAMFATMFATAQVTDVNWNVNDSAMGTITCIHPVVYFDTIVTYDTAMVCDTVGDVIDTNYVYDTITVVDTTYNTNQWFLIAEANDGYIFGYWVNTYTNADTTVSDTVLSEFNLIDITDLDYDAVTCIAYFDALESITDIEHINGITVYPNPTTSIVRFSRPVTEYWLYDECGKSVMCGVNGNMIDMSAYPSGMYFLKTRTGVTKIIKK